MKFTKMLALLCVVALFVGMFAACGNSTEAASAVSAEEASEAVEEATTEETAPAEEAAPADEPAATEASAVDEAETEPAATAENIQEAAELASGLDFSEGYELPLFDPADNVTFTMWVSFSDIGGDFMPEGFSNNLAYLAATEDTGVTIDMHQVSTDSNSEQFNLMIASGDYVDIITNVGQLWTASYDSAIEDDIFMDLTELTSAENMPYYAALYDQLSDSVKKDLHTDSGYMPKLISINPYPDGATEGAFIRQDILDDLGLEVPQTYDDLYDVLAAMKDSGMNEPLMLTDGIVHTSNALCSGYDVNGGFSVFPMTSTPWMVVDGEIKFGIAEEGYKEYMQMIVDFYQAGYIDPDFATENSNPMSSDFAGKCASDDVGIFFGETGMVPEYYSLALNENYDAEPLAEITKEAGATTHFGTYKSEISGRLATIAICTTAEGREAELGKYLDFFFTERGALYSFMGIEGNEDGSYIYDENGALQYSDNWNTIDISSTSKSTYFIYSCIPGLKPEGVPSTYTLPVQEYCGDVWDSNADADYKIPDSLSLTAEESEEQSAIYSDIQTLISENLLKFVMGDRSMDEWDDFVQEMWDMGLQDVIDIEQTGYDRYLERAV